MGVLEQFLHDLSLATPPPDIAGAIERATEPVLRAARVDFMAMSRGGRSADGQAWLPTKKGTPILFRTGALFRSLSARCSGRRIEIFFDEHQAPYADYALAKRPLWSGDEVPASWLQELSFQLQRELQVVLNDRKRRVGWDSPLELAVV